MTLRDVQTLLEGELLTPGATLEIEFSGVFASDLMSDVLAFMNPRGILLTGQVNAHVVRTARLVEVAGIVVIQGKRPDAKVVGEAGENEVPIIATACSMFEACSRISRVLPEGGR